MTEQMQETVSALIRNAEWVTLASVSPEGFPRACAMSKLEVEGETVFYFSTGADGEKTAHFRKNPKASVMITDGKDSITYTGHVAIVYNPQVKEDVWQPWMIQHFPGGYLDPNYCVLRFTASRGTYWIGGEFWKAAL